MVQVICLESVSSATLAVPLPAEAVAGVSAAPSSVAVKLRISACVAPAKTAAAAAKAVKSVKRIVGLPFMSPVGTVILCRHCRQGQRFRGDPGIGPIVFFP